MQKIMIVGVGRVGCFILRELAEQNKFLIHIVDHDIVEHHNLAEQFLYSHSDVGTSKVEAAKKNLFYGLIEISACKFEDLDLGFACSFDVIIGCVDSLYVRRKINQVLFFSNAENQIYIDCGFNYNMAHIKITKPRITSCIECILNLFANGTVLQNYSCCANASYTNQEIIYNNYEKRCEENNSRNSILKELSFSVLKIVDTWQENECDFINFCLDGGIPVKNLLSISPTKDCPICDAFY